MNNSPAITEAQRQELIDFMQGSRTYRYEEWSRLSKLRDQITLAALTAEPFAYSYQYAGVETCDGFKNWSHEISTEVPPDWMLETGKAKDLRKLYADLPAPAPVLRVPDELKVKNGSHQSHIDYAEGWADCIDEVKRLNAQPSPPEASNEQ